MSGLVLKTANNAKVISDAEAQAHCKVDSNDDLALVQLYRDAATQDVENYLRRAILRSTWLYYLDDFPTVDSRYAPDCIRRGEIVFPLMPFFDCISVKYFDTAGDEQTLPTDEYFVDGNVKPARIVPAADEYWPLVQLYRPSAVVIEFRAGYTDAAAVPPAIKAAIMLRLGTLYNNREDQVVGASVTPLSEVITSLLGPYVNRWNT